MEVVVSRWSDMRPAEATTTSPGLSMACWRSARTAIELGEAFDQRDLHAVGIAAHEEGGAQIGDAWPATITTKGWAASCLMRK